MSIDDAVRAGDATDDVTPAGAAAAAALDADNAPVMVGVIVDALLVGFTPPPTSNEADADRNADGMGNISLSNVPVADAPPPVAGVTLAPRGDTSRDNMVICNAIPSSIGDE